MIFSLDGLWERLKKRSPRLAASDRTDDQSHDGHAFVTVILGGALGAAVLTVLGFTPWVPDYPMDTKLAIGCLIVNAGYCLREIEVRNTLGWGYKPWDGIMDCYKPACFWVPTTLGLAAGWWMMLGLAVLYYLFRPCE